MMPDFSQQTEPLKRLSSKRISLFLKIGLCTALSLHILVFLLLQVNSNTLPEREASRPYVTFVSEKSLAKDVELEEYALLFDSAPLFIPTRWNASQWVKVDFEPMSRGPFRDFEPNIELSGELQPNDFQIADGYSVNEPVDLLASRFWRFFEGFGQLTDSVSAFDPAVPVAEIYVIGESENPTVSFEVDLESSASFSIIRPASYTIRRSNEGLIWSTPMLVETSGNEAFDQSVAQWLQRPDILAQLPIGYLSVRVFFW